MTTNVPAITFGAAGFTAPSAQTILTGVQTDMNAAFGGYLNLTNPNSPQAQLAAATADIIGEAKAQYIGLFNGVDPALASGRVQDAIGRIYFIERNPAQPTVVQVTCTGLAGVNIPVGALVQDNNGNLYACTEAGTIPQSGSITLTFANTVNGPIPCAVNAIQSIYQAIPGWNSAANPAEGVLGNVVESPGDFEIRRSASVAWNAIGSVASVQGAVLSVANVLDAYVIDNPAATPLSVGASGCLLPPHSLYVAVSGGESAAVAQAIWAKKGPGCVYYTGPSAAGAIVSTVDVIDPNPLYATPPVYPVSYVTPADTPVYFTVTLAGNAAAPDAATALSLVSGALLASFSGADGGPRARIGSTLLASRYYAGVAALGPWVQIVSIQVGIAPDSMGDDLSLGIDQIPTFDPANVNLVLPGWAPVFS